MKSVDSNKTLAKSLALSVAGMSLVAWTGCGDGGGEDVKTPQPMELRTYLGTNLGELSTQLSSALTVLQDSAVLTSTLDGLQAIPGVGSAIVTIQEDNPKFAEGDSGIDQIVQYLNEYVFTDANYVGEGQYQITPDALCEKDETGAPLQDCESLVLQANLRIKVEETDLMKFTLLVGDDSFDPVYAELGTGHLKVGADLAEVKNAVSFLASLSEEEVTFPETFAGEISLTVDAAADTLDVAFAIENDVSIAFSASGSEVSFSSAKKTPLLAVSVNTTTKEASFLLDIGQTQFSFPWSVETETASENHTLAVDLKGLSGSVTLSENQQTLDLTNLGLGDGTTTVKLDGQNLVAVDFNAELDRRMDLSIKPQADALPTFTMTPGAALQVAFSLQPLIDAGDTVDSWFADETISVSMLGDGEAVVQPVVTGVDEFGEEIGALKLVKGNLSISAENADASISVAEGQCLAGDVVTEEEHPLVGAFVSTSCE